MLSFGGIYIVLSGVLLLCDLIASCDGYTKTHCDKVTEYALAIADKLGWGPDKKVMLKYRAEVHDIGKIAIKKDILNKPGKLTKEEYETLKRHTVLGSNFLRKFSEIKGIHIGALYHHERWDGNGYPSGLLGSEIPIDARIIGIADAYDAMSSDRCYRPKCSESYIRSELIAGKGRQFDPRLVDIMLEIIDEKKAS